VNVIVLTGGTYDGDRFIGAPDPSTFLELKTGADAHRLWRVTRGTWRIVRTDRWKYDERVVDALRQLAERPGVELVDPTGLLGGSRAGGRDPDRRDSAAPDGQDRTKVPRRARSLNTQLPG